MFKKNILLVLFLMGSVLVSAQISFKKIYFAAPGRNFIAREIDSSGFDLWYGSNLYRINQIGDTVFRHGYATGNGDWFMSRAQQAYDKSTIITASWGESCSCCSSNYTRTGVLALVDSQYNIVWSKHYQLSSECGTTSANVYCDKNKNFLMCGYTINDTTHGIQYPFVIKTDSSGEILWSHKFQTLQNARADLVVQTLDGNYLVGLNLDDTIGAVLMKTDTAGQTLWIKRYNLSRSYLFGILEDADSSLLIYGQDQYRPYNFNLFISRLTKDGSVVWGKRYEDSTFTTGDWKTEIIHTFDGNYGVATSSVENVNRNFLLTKIDVNGEVLWGVSHGDQPHDEIANGLIETKDHGFLIGGEVWGYFPGYNRSLTAQIIKTDSSGHAGCEEQNKNIVAQPCFLVDSIIPVIPFIDGATSIVGTVHDSTFGNPFEGAYNKCIFTNVHEPPRIRKEATVYPNPNKGEFNIKPDQSPSPILITSFITVYNSMGRIVLQRPILKEEDKQIDLTNQGKGIYILKIIEGDKITSSKVVVE